MDIANVALMHKVLLHITHHPDQWDQTSWARISYRSSCRTACCFAGHAVLLSGEPLRYGEEYGTRIPLGLDDDDYGTVREGAERLLGLDFVDSARLFSGRNTLRDLWRICEELTEGEIKESEFDDVLEANNTVESY